jgi:hypothetical protein
LPSYPAIPKPSADLVSLLKTVEALKESVEILTQQRGERATGTVTYPGAPISREQVQKYGSYEELRDTIVNGHD